MKFTHIKNIEKFEAEFTSFYKKEVVYNDGVLSKEDFLGSLRVFYWFVEENDFQDLREACKRFMTIMNNEDPIRLGLFNFIKAYVEEGDLDCTVLSSDIINNIPQTIRALSNTYKSLTSSGSSDIDVSVFSDLERKFKHLENARSSVLSYIGRMGYKHLDELSVCSKFHPSDIEEILYELSLMTDELTKDERQEVVDFVRNIVDIASLDLESDPSYMTEMIQDFINENKIE